MKKTLLAIFTIGMFASCSLTRPYAVTNNTVGSKKGISSTVIIGGYSGGEILASGLLVLNGDFGVIEAAKKGKINTIGCVDVKSTNYLFFQKVDIIVTGE